jgi:hypothetical protein
LLSACLCIAIGFTRVCAGHLAGPGMMQGTMQQQVIFFEVIIHSSNGDDFHF